MFNTYKQGRPEGGVAPPGKFRWEKYQRGDQGGPGGPREKSAEV
jgi:hypothetical protein